MLVDEVSDDVLDVVVSVDSENVNGVEDATELWLKPALALPGKSAEVRDDDEAVVEANPEPELETPEIEAFAASETANATPDPCVVADAEASTETSSSASSLGLNKDKTNCDSSSFSCWACVFVKSIELLAAVIMVSAWW